MLVETCCYFLRPLTLYKACRDCLCGRLCSYTKVNIRISSNRKTEQGCQTACKTFQIRGGNSVQKFPPPCVILRRFCRRYLECYLQVNSSKRRKSTSISPPPFPKTLCDAIRIGPNSTKIQSPTNSTAFLSLSTETSMYRWVVTIEL